MKPAAKITLGVLGVLGLGGLALWWLAGMAFFGALWLATQPRLKKGAA